MKKYLILIGCSLLYIGCERDLTVIDDSKDLFDIDDPSILEKNSFSEGIYMGYFELRDQNYWCEIQFISNEYEEWPSGGAYYQKDMQCLTTGTFIISTDTLKYDLGEYKFPTFSGPCNSKMILPGDYRIHLITMNDSLVFSKGVGKDKIKYHLSRILK